MTTFIEKIKANKVHLSLVVGGLVLIVLVGVMLMNQQGEKKELEAKHAALVSELNKYDMDIAKRQADLDSQKQESVKEATGLDPKLVSVDTQAAEQFFAPAFNWQSGSEYDKVREDYIRSLGKDNSFTKTYLPPDTKIDTEDGKLSFIDHERLKVTMDSIFIVPTTAEGDRVRYVAFVTYFAHKDKKDLVNPDALEASEAIIEFTAAGDPKEGDRRVSEVKAGAGFASALD